MLPTTVFGLVPDHPEDDLPGDGDVPGDGFQVDASYQNFLDWFQDHPQDDLPAGDLGASAEPPQPVAEPASSQVADRSGIVPANETTDLHGEWWDDPSWDGWWNDPSWAEGQPWAGAETYALPNPSSDIKLESKQDEGICQSKCFPSGFHDDRSNMVGGDIDGELRDGAHGDGPAFDNDQFEVELDQSYEALDQPKYAPDQEPFCCSEACSELFWWFANTISPIIFFEHLCFSCC